MVLEPEKHKITTSQGQQYYHTCTYTVTLDILQFATDLSVMFKKNADTSLSGLKSNQTLQY